VQISKRGFARKIAESANSKQIDWQRCLLCEDAVSTAVPWGDGSQTISTSKFLVPSVVQTAFRIHDSFTLSQLERITR